MSFLAKRKRFLAVGSKLKMGHRTERSIGLSRSTLGASLNAKPAGLDPFFFPSLSLLDVHRRCSFLHLSHAPRTTVFLPKLLFLQLSSFSPYESIPARACSFCSFVFLVPLAQAQVETLYTLLSTSLPIQIIQYISPSLSLSFSPPFFDFISSFSFCVRFRSPVFLCESSLPSPFFFPPRCGCRIDTVPCLPARHQPQEKKTTTVEVNKV